MSADKEARRRSTILHWLMYAETLLVKGNNDAAVMHNLMTFKGTDPISAEKIVYALRNAGPRFVLDDDDYKVLVADLMEHAVMNTTFRSKVSELRAMMDAHNEAPEAATAEPRAPARESRRAKRSGSSKVFVVLGALLVMIGIVVLIATILTGGALLAPPNVLLWAGLLALGLILLVVEMIGSAQGGG